MVNTLVHRTDVLERETVETVSQLADAVCAWQGPGKGDRPLDRSYVVELVAEILSDGSEALSVRLRPAEPQV